MNSSGDCWSQGGTVACLEESHCSGWVPRRTTRCPHNGFESSKSFPHRRQMPDSPTSWYSAGRSPSLTPPTLLPGHADPGPAMGATMRRQPLRVCAQGERHWLWWTVYRSGYPRGGQASLSTSSETRPRHRAVGGGPIVVGLLLVAAGAVWLLGNLGLINVSFGLVGSVLLTALGVALVVLARSGPHRGLVAVGVLLTVVLAIFTGIGSPSRTIHPSAASALRPSYELGFGSLTVDLGDLNLPSGDTSLRAHVGTGKVAVIVPPSVGIQVRAEAGTGRVAILGHHREGTGIEDTFRTANFGSADRRLLLDVSAGTGSVEVDR